VLPFPPAEFRAVSVDFASGDWAQRFERARAAAASVTITGRHDPGDGASTFEHANRVFTDIARRRAQALRVPLRALAVLDSSAGGAAGGTAAIAALWRSQGLPYEQVDVAQLRLACAGSASALGVAGRSQRPP
jgi:hypothetical protein